MSFEQELLERLGRMSANHRQLVYDFFDLSPRTQAEMDALQEKLALSLWIKAGPPGARLH